MRVDSAQVLDLEPIFCCGRKAWRCAAVGMFCVLLLPTLASAELPAALRSQVNQLREQGRFEPAVRLINGHLVLHPDDTEALLALADVRLSQKKPRQATFPLERLARLMPHNAIVLDRLVNAWVQVGRPDEAAAVLMLEGASTDVALMRRVADLYGASDRPKEQAAMLDRMVAVAPKNVSLHRELAELREHLKQYRDARYEWLAILALQPQDAEVLRRLGRMYAYTHLEREAIRAYESALALAPAHEPTLRALIQLYGWNDMERRRQAALGELIRIRPKDQEAREALVETLLAQDRVAAATRHLETLTRQRPWDLGLSLRLAKAYGSADRIADATHLLEDILSRDPGNLDAARRLARTYSETGDRPSALDVYRRVQEVDGGDPFVAKEIARLEIETDPRISAGYEMIENQYLTSHLAYLRFEHEPSSLLRYRGSYNFGWYSGSSFVGAGSSSGLMSHGGGLGVSLRMAPRTYLDVDVMAAAYDAGIRDEAFLGYRVGFRQGLGERFKFEVWTDRHEQLDTVDAILANTAVFAVGANLEWSFFGPLFVQALGSYGRYHYTNRTADERVGNNGYQWEAGLGVAILDQPEDPVSFEMVADYTGEHFGRSYTTDPLIPYFAPDLYQTLGLRFRLEQTPIWRVRWLVEVRPYWAIDDRAMQMEAAAEIQVKVHQRHWFSARYARTETFVGQSEAIFTQNLLRVSWTSVF